MKREIALFAPDAAVEWPSNPAWRLHVVLDDLVGHYDAEHSPERTAKEMMENHESDLVREAVEHAAQFSEHYFGAQNDEWTAAVLAALRGKE